MRILLGIIITFLIAGYAKAEVISTNKLWAVYYGTPSAVNGSTTWQEATNIWKKFRVVVFAGDIVDGTGDGYGDNTHPDYHNTSNIIVSLSNRVDFYGYVDLGVSTKNWTTNQMKSLVDQWKLIGAEGIFWDDAGYDYGTTRDRQIWAVNYSHSKGMKVIMNAWNPNHVLGTTDDPSYPNSIYNPDLKPSPLQPGDGYCWENFLVVSNQIAYNHSSSGLRQSLDFWKTKSDKCLSYKYNSTFNGNLNILCLSTLSNNATSNAFTSASNLSDYAFWGFTLYGFDYWQFTDYNYSAGNDYVYIYNRPSITNYAGDNYVTTSVESTTNLRQYKRVTDQGIIYFNASNNIQPTNMGWFEPDTNGPSKPQGLSVTAQADGIYISWSNPIADYYITYLFKSTTNFILNPSSNTDAIIYRGTGTYYLDQNITSGTTYYYTVFAQDKVGNFSSPATNKILYIDSFPPDKPQDFTGNSDGISKVVLIWKKNTEFDIAGYNVYRKGLNDNSYKKLNSLLITNNVYSDTNLTDGRYTYYLTAVDKAGNESLPSEKITAYIGDYYILKDKNINITDNFVNLVERKYFRVYFLLSSDEEVKFIVYNIYGRKIKEYSERFTSGLNTYSIDCTGLDSGVYVLKIKSPSIAKEYKFIVVK